jgi:hypothetical protein
MNPYTQTAEIARLGVSLLNGGSKTTMGSLALGTKVERVK